MYGAQSAVRDASGVMEKEHGPLPASTGQPPQPTKPAAGPGVAVYVTVWPKGMPAAVQVPAHEGRLVPLTSPSPG